MIVLLGVIIILLGHLQLVYWGGTIAAGLAVVALLFGSWVMAKAFDSKRSHIGTKNDEKLRGKLNQIYQRKDKED